MTIKTTDNLKSTDLPSQTIEKLHWIFAQYPEIEKVCLYGSRAKGNFSSGSDIDLTIMGKKLTTTQLLAIETQIDDLLLPYTIDLCLFEKIENSNLVDHIQRVGIEFYSRQAYDS